MLQDLKKKRTEVNLAIEYQQIFIETQCTPDFSYVLIHFWKEREG